jgi:hypothetical protein
VDPAAATVREHIKKGVEQAWGIPPEEQQLDRQPKSGGGGGGGEGKGPPTARGEGGASAWDCAWGVGETCGSP